MPEKMQNWILKQKYINKMAEVTLDALIAELKEMISTLQHHGGYFPHDEYPDKERYEKWLAATKRFLNIHFPQDKYVIEFEETSKLILRLGQQQRLLAILEAFANQPTIIPKENNEKKDKGINIAINNTNNQSQSQKQSFAINMFLEAIKDDLTGKQIKELKKIIDESGNDKGKAKNGIISKLKSFGSDVASNIVANIITNPMIWTNL